MVYTGRVIAGANGVKDLAGNAMESDYVWSFKTAAIVEPKYIIFDKFVMLGDTHFQFDKANLSPAGEELLKQDIKIMQDNPNLKVRIAGYASASGSVAHNQDLSERRAESVMSYMILQGNLAADRFDTIGYGNTRPANYESNPSDINSKAARSNMRVLFEVIAK
jgi:OOP family OmpA-OmpF porin